MAETQEVVELPEGAGRLTIHVSGEGPDDVDFRKTVDRVAVKGRLALRDRYQQLLEALEGHHVPARDWTTSSPLQEVFSGEVKLSIAVSAEMEKSFNKQLLVVLLTKLVEDDLVDLALRELSEYEGKAVSTAAAKKGPDSA